VAKFRKNRQTDLGDFTMKTKKEEKLL